MYILGPFISVQRWGFCIFENQEVEFLKNEIHHWISSILMRNWARTSRSVEAGEKLTEEMIDFKTVDRLETLKKFPPPDGYIPPTLDDISKTKEK